MTYLQETHPSQAFYSYIYQSMRWDLNDYTIDFSNVDLPSVLAAWHWRIGEMERVLFITILGDLFLEARDRSIYWLATDTGEFSKVAESNIQFEVLLTGEAYFDEWFLPGLIEKLQIAGKLLSGHEVYSYLKLPVLGGSYGIENIEPTDLDVHFTFTGQIYEQIKDLPDGTNVRLVINGEDYGHV